MTEAVVQACDALYAPNSDATSRSQANKYLSQWQISPESFEQATVILQNAASSPTPAPPYVVILMSQTLRTKVEYGAIVAFIEHPEAEPRIVGRPAYWDQRVIGGYRVN